MVKKKSKNLITKIDADIISSLYRAKRPLSVKRLAERVGVSWPTVNEHVKKLVDIGPLKIEKTIRKTRVYIDYEFLKPIIKKAEEMGTPVEDIQVNRVEDI